jgi:hypothetical protein
MLMVISLPLKFKNVTTKLPLYLWLSTRDPNKLAKYLYGRLDHSF